MALDIGNHIIGDSHIMAITIPIGELAMAGAGAIHIMDTDTVMATLIMVMATIPTTTTIHIIMVFLITGAEEIRIITEQKRAEDLIMFQQEILPTAVLKFRDA